MTKNKENKIIAEKVKEWDQQIKPFDLFLGRLIKRAKKYYKYMVEWYFFYKPTDNGDKALHILLMLFVDAIILRFFGII